MYFHEQKRGLRTSSWHGGWSGAVLHYNVRTTAPQCVLTTAARDIGCFDLLYTRYTLECPAHNERTGTTAPGDGSFHNKIVEQVNSNQTCFHYLRSDNTRNMTPPLGSIVFVRMVRRLRDLYYSQAARRRRCLGGVGCMLPRPVPYEYCTRIHGPSYEFMHQDTTYQRLLGCTVRCRHI